MATSSDHLNSEDLYDHVESRFSGRRLREVQDHLGACPDCAETLAMLLRAERPASREEEALLARARSVSPEERVAALRPAIEDSMPARAQGGGIEWRPLLVALAVLVIVGTAGLLVYTRYLVPAQSRRVAAETLSALIELRQGTGRLPLRYLTELERASVTRSAFDDTAGEERALLDNLREVVADSDEIEPKLILALLLLDDGQLDESEELLREVLEVEPRSASALNGLAVVHYARAELQPAEAYALRQRGLAYLRQAQSADPDDLRVLYNFGKFYEVLEMQSAAAQAWARYLERDQTSHWAEEAAYQLRQLQPR